MTAAQRELGAVQPPPEVAAAHSTLLAAAGMAVRASATRFDAVRSGSMDTAWQAASAAAGALMLLDQSTLELRRITRSSATTTTLITPRVTRLLRASDLRTFQSAIAGVVPDGLTARATAIVVPSRSAAEELRRTLEELALPDGLPTRLR